MHSIFDILPLLLPIPLQFANASMIYFCLDKGKIKYEPELLMTDDNKTPDDDDGQLNFAHTHTYILI